MTDVRSVPGAAPAAAPAAPAAVEYRDTQTDSFPALLRQLGASLMVTTYQANKLLVARAAGAGVSMLVRTFDRPMGLAVDRGRLALGTRDQVGTSATPRTSPRRSSRPASTTPASCRAPRT
jgi:hypothetical protein